MRTGWPKGVGAALTLAAAVCLSAVATSFDAAGAAPDELAGVFEVVQDTTAAGGGVRSQLKVKPCPTETAIPGEHARLPGKVTVEAPVGQKAGLHAFGTANGALLPAPHGWECSASLGVDGTQTILAGPKGSIAGRRGASRPHGESIQASLIPACQGCIASTICSFFPRADVVGAYEPTLDCDEKAARESRLRLSRSAVLFADPSGVAGASPESGGALPSVGVVTYGRWVGARQLNCTVPASEMSTCAAVIVAFLDLGRRG